MKHTTQNRLNRILRNARQNVFDNDDYSRIIARCKELLMPIWEKQSTDRHALHTKAEQDRFLTLQ